MKTKLGIMVIVLIVAIINLPAQDVTTVEAASAEISDNLDLEAVASLFGEAKNLEDFEQKLNDPQTQISNLDLNNDGEVDYLRVVENSKDNTHVVSIQAVIDKDKYQDVATIVVEKDDKGETQVQVVGDVYMYGPEYVIIPVYVTPPVVAVWFWGSYYKPWHSPYYWGYYPSYYRPWSPYPPHVYRRNVHVHVSAYNSYHRTNAHRSSASVNIQNNARRNDFGASHPDKSFNNRNRDVNNRQELENNRSSNGANSHRSNNTPANNARPSTGKKVQDNWKPQSERNGNKSNVRDNKTSTPANHNRAQPAQQKRESTAPKSNQGNRPANRNSAPALKSQQQKAKPANKQSGSTGAVKQSNGQQRNSGGAKPASSQQKSSKQNSSGASYSKSR